ncbi:MAG: hypothetical protein MI748_08720 [Opitutales bacterium]|nr:hypothetical protein [Opitutales bacterium]
MPPCEEKKEVAAVGRASRRQMACYSKLVKAKSTHAYSETHLREILGEDFVEREPTIDIKAYDDAAREGDIEISTTDANNGQELLKPATTSISDYFKQRMSAKGIGMAAASVCKSTELWLQRSFQM